MRYEGIVYRPPSEAYSLIIQVTIGCAHNQCTFCSMYKDKRFRIRTLEEIFQDLYEAKRAYGKVKRIFLADGDALVLKTELLIQILQKINELFPECERVSSYVTPRDILNKSLDDIKILKSLGIGMLYMGIESGSDEILKQIQKGVTSLEVIEAGRKIKESGIKLSVTFISGIGGKDKSIEHAVKSASVINAINPDYVGLLTLMVEANTRMYDDVNCGRFKLLEAQDIILETKEFIKNIDVTNCIFRSNHASNYVSIGGTLPQDKGKILALIDDILKSKFSYKNEKYRSL